MMLELKNICKTYLQGKMEVPVLKNVSLSVEEGEYVAIMGPSGSGKTTLMNLIGCLDVPTSGEYLLDGEEVSQLNDAKMSELRLHCIGFVFQSFYLLPRQSALDNVALPLLYAGVKRRDRMEIARKALERVGLGDRADFKPTQLSGGQCQRVAIARAMVSDPKVLLADEPTGALDTKSGEQIMDIFKALNQEGVTIVMITHEPDIAAHADRILHIRDGRLVDAFGNFLAPEEPEHPEGDALEELISKKEAEPEDVPEEDESEGPSIPDEPTPSLDDPLSPPESEERPGEEESPSEEPAEAEVEDQPEHNPEVSTILDEITRWQEGGPAPDPISPPEETENMAESLPVDPSVPASEPTPETGECNNTDTQNTSLPEAKDVPDVQPAAENDPDTAEDGAGKFGKPISLDLSLAVSPASGKEKSNKRGAFHQPISIPLEELKPDLTPDDPPEKP